MALIRSNVIIVLKKKIHPTHATNKKKQAKKHFPNTVLGTWSKEPGPHVLKFKVQVSAPQLWKEVDYLGLDDDNLDLVSRRLDHDLQGIIEWTTTAWSWKGTSDWTPWNSFQTYQRPLCRVGDNLLTRLGSTEGLLDLNSKQGKIPLVKIRLCLKLPNKWITTWKTGCLESSGVSITECFSEKKMTNVSWFIYNYI